MRLQRNIFEQVDWIIVLIYLVLILCGWLNIYAAVYNEEHSSIFDISQRYGKQLLWIVAAIFIALVIFIIDSKFYDTFSYFIYAFIILLLISVLIIGEDIKGARSWFVIGSFSIQPSEFAKFATNLALAKYLSGIHIRIKELKTKLWSSLIIGLPAILILLQGDAGSTLVYIAFIFVLYRQGLSGNFLLLGLFLAVLFILSLLLRTTSLDLFEVNVSGTIILISILILIASFIIYVFKKHKQSIVLIILGLVLSVGFIESVDYVFENILESHQAKRINILLGIETDPQGAGYNVNQSKIAIGSGGFSGKGYLQGTQTKYRFVPEQSTDFIFCTVGEEWGFIGSLFVVVLFLTLFIRIMFIAERQRSDFTKIYAYGVASIFFFHFAINIGMAIGLAPVIGIPLPFFSYGGSSLWSFTILLFILIKLDADRLLYLR